MPPPVASLLQFEHIHGNPMEEEGENALLMELEYLGDDVLEYLDKSGHGTLDGSAHGTLDGSAHGTLDSTIHTLDSSAHGTLDGSHHGNLDWTMHGSCVDGQDATPKAAYPRTPALNGTSTIMEHSCEACKRSKVGGPRFLIHHHIQR
jgi:hypothetical protein